MLLELLDHAIKIGIAGAKAPCEPVPTALGNRLAVSDHLELTGLTRRKDGFNAEALFDEGHETRDLDLVVLSRRTVNNLDLHLFSNLLRVQCSFIRGVEEFAEKTHFLADRVYRVPRPSFAWAGVFVGLLTLP